MTCPNCGHRVRDGAKFCDECGIVLPESSGVAVASEPVQPAAPPRRLAAPNRSQGGFSGRPVPSDTEVLPPPVDLTRTRRMFALVAIILVAMLCFCCAVAAAMLYLLTQTPAPMLLPGVV